MKQNIFKIPKFITLLVKIIGLTLLGLCTTTTAAATSWSRVLFEKLKNPQLLKKFANFMEPKISVVHSQEPASYPYTEADRSLPCPSVHFSKINFNIILQSTSESCKWSPFFKIPH